MQSVNRACKKGVFFDDLFATPCLMFQTSVVGGGGERKECRKEKERKKHAQRMGRVWGTRRSGSVVPYR